MLEEKLNHIINTFFKKQKEISTASLNTATTAKASDTIVHSPTHSDNSSYSNTAIISNTGSSNTGSSNTGSSNTGSSNTGSSNTGSNSNNTSEPIQKKEKESDISSIKVQEKSPSGTISSPLVLHNKKFLGIPISRGDVDSIPLVITPEGKLGLPVDRQTAAFMKGKGENSFIGMMKKMKEFFTGGGNTQSMGGGSYNAETGEYTGVSQYESSISSPPSGSFSYAEYRENQHNQQTAERIASRPETVTPLASSHIPSGSVNADSNRMAANYTYNPNEKVVYHGKERRSAPPDIERLILKMSEKYKLNPAAMMTIARKESNYGSSAKAKDSSAKGIFQIIGQLKNGRVTGARGEAERLLPYLKKIPNWTSNPEHNIEAAGRLTDVFIQYFNEGLRKRGHKPLSKSEISPELMYSIWWLGGGGAAKLYDAAIKHPNESALKYIGNPKDKSWQPGGTNYKLLSGKTNSQVLSHLRSKLNDVAVDVGNYSLKGTSSISSNSLSPLPGTPKPVSQSIPQQSTAQPVTNATMSANIPTNAEQLANYYFKEAERFGIKFDRNTGMVHQKEQVFRGSGSKGKNWYGGIWLPTLVRYKQYEEMLRKAGLADSIAVTSAARPRTVADTNALQRQTGIFQKSQERIYHEKGGKGVAPYWGTGIGEHVADLSGKTLATAMDISFIKNGREMSAEQFYTSPTVKKYFNATSGLDAKQKSAMPFGIYGSAGNGWTTSKGYGEQWHLGTTPDKEALILKDYWQKRYGKNPLKLGAGRTANNDAKVKQAIERRRYSYNPVQMMQQNVQRQSQNIEDRRSTTPEVQTTPQVANVQPLMQQTQPIQQTSQNAVRSGGSNGIPNKMAKKIGDMAIERSKRMRSVGSCAAGVKHIVAMAHGFMRYDQRNKILEAGSAKHFLTNGSLEKAGFRVISENTAKGYRPMPGDIIVYKKANNPGNPKDLGVIHGHVQVYGSDGNWYSDHKEGKKAGYEKPRYGYKGSIYKIYRLPPEKEPDATVQEEQPQSQAEVIPSNEQVPSGQVPSSTSVQNQQTAQQYSEPIAPELAPQAEQTVSPIITPAQSETVAENVSNAAVVASNIPSGNLKMDTAIIHAQNVVINGNVENTNKTNEEQTQETLETVPQDNVQIPFVQTQEQASAELVKSEPLLQYSQPIGPQPANETKQDNVQIPFVQTQEQASAELVKSEPLLQTQQTVKKEQPTITHSELFGNSLEKLGVTGVSSFLPTNNPLGNFGFEGIGSIGSNIGSSIGNIGNIINGIMSSVQNAMSIPQQIAGNVQSVIGNVQGIIGQVKNIPQNVIGQAQSIAQPIANLIKNPKEFLRNPASAIGSISGSVQNAIGTVSSIIKNPMESLGLGNIGSSIGSIANQIGGIFNPQNYDMNKMLAVGGGFGGAIGAGTPFFEGVNAGNLQSNVPLPNLDVFQNNNQKINEVRTDTLMQNDVQKQQAASQPQAPIMIGGGGGYPNGGGNGGGGENSGQSPAYGSYTGINNIGPSGMLGINEDLYVQFLRLRQAASGFGIL